MHPGQPKPLVSHATPLAAVFEADCSTSRAVGAMVEGCGFVVVSFTEPPVDLSATVKSIHPEVVVFELAMAGAQGLGVVGDLLDAVPGCGVILLAPFENLREAALHAGAFELIANDMGALERCLHELRRRRATLRAASAPDAAVC